MCDYFEINCNVLRDLDNIGCRDSLSTSGNTNKTCL